MSEKSKIEERFNQFWMAYPKKVNKPQAYKSFSKLNPSEQLTDNIVLAVNRAKKTKQWQENNGKYIPHPSTYLNGRRWEDELVLITNQITVYDDDDILT